MFTQAIMLMHRSRDYTRACDITAVIRPSVNRSFMAQVVVTVIEVNRQT